MSGQQVDRDIEEQGAESLSPAKLAAGLAAALAAVFVLVTLFRVTLMPQDERYLRGCMQDTARLTGHGGFSARLYRSFPWFSPGVEPRDPGMKKVWNFCKEMYSRESDSHALHGAMSATVEGSHTYAAAMQVVQRIDKGWSEFPDSKKQREILQKALDTWDVNGHNPDVQRILEGYNERVSQPDTIQNYHRIFTVRQGRFESRDICRHRMLFEKWRVAANPAHAYSRIPCK